ncbi:hypothetical protein PLICRDRAFT_172127 [Plicaturopsis crispa FD-325 SS-3]|nr:hypothetical protein PLICRDRAFT_172127 [Plicaturopsis crispa FD-325 SS-3]
MTTPHPLQLCRGWLFSFVFSLRVTGQIHTIPPSDNTTTATNARRSADTTHRHPHAPRPLPPPTPPIYRPPTPSHPTAAGPHTAAQPQHLRPHIESTPAQTGGVVSVHVHAHANTRPRPTTPSHPHASTPPHTAAYSTRGVFSPAAPRPVGASTTWPTSTGSPRLASGSKPSRTATACSEAAHREGDSDGDGSGVTESPVADRWDSTGERDTEEHQHHVHERQRRECATLTPRPLRHWPPTAALIVSPSWRDRKKRAATVSAAAAHSQPLSAFFKPVPPSSRKRQLSPSPLDENQMSDPEANADEISIRPNVGLNSDPYLENALLDRYVEELEKGLTDGSDDA